MVKQSYQLDKGTVKRVLCLDGQATTSTIVDMSSLEGTGGWERWWRSYLLGQRSRSDGQPLEDLAIADIFCGCGGLTLGAIESAVAAGYRPIVRLAIDTDAAALSVYERNLRPEVSICTDVRRLIDYHVAGWADTARFGYPPRLLHRALLRVKDRIDLVLAGPPCEGYSQLNNRRHATDPRNFLYLDAVALAAGLGARAVAIENVPNVAYSRLGVIDTALALLECAGYRTTHGILAAHRLGWPQTRRRHFILASQHEPLPIEALERSFARPPLGVWWAIEDLVDCRVDPVMDAPANLSEDNRQRIDYLFNHDLYELPNELRPMCHRYGHTYRAVYGRLHWDRPAGTITKGYTVPGQGRFIHPLRRRTLTPHEAARLQGFPDWFQFASDGGHRVSRQSLRKWIGNAVPTILGYSAILAVLSKRSRASGPAPIKI